MLAKRRRQLLVLGAAGFALLVITYLVMVRTSLGQSLGDQAFLGRKDAGLGAGETSGLILRLVDEATVAIFCLILVGIGVARRRWPVGLLAAAVFGGSIVLAEIGKKVLPRPELAEIEGQLKSHGFNTFPSGHSTIAVGFVLGLIWVSSPRWRPWLTVIGAIWASLMTSGTLAAGWHRPSDAVGGVGLAVGCAALAVAILAIAWGQIQSAPSTARIILPGSLAVLAVAEFGILVSLAGGNLDAAGDLASPYAFPVASAAIDAITIAAIATFGWLVRDLDLAPRGLPSLGSKAEQVDQADVTPTR